MTSSPRDLSASVDREEIGKFEEALVGAASEADGKNAETQEAQDKKTPVVSRSKSAAETKKISAHDKEVETPTSEASEMIPDVADVEVKQIDAMAVSDIMAMIRSMASEESETTIDELIAHVADVAPKSTRFDPDLILGIKQGEEPQVEPLPIDEAMADLDVQLKDIASVAAPAGVQTQPKEIVPDELALPEDAVVGDDGEGEIKIKLPETSDSKVKDPITAEDKVDQAASKIAAEDKAAEDIAEHVDARPAIDAPVKDDRLSGERELDRKIAEMLDKYEERRRGEESQMPRSHRAEDRTAQKKASSSAFGAKKISVQPQQQTRDSRADHAREVPFSDSLASRLREASDQPISEAQKTFRAGMVYEMSREDAFRDGLGTVLEFMRTDETQEARIVVEPPALGHIDISLRATEAGMEAHFKVDNEHLKQMVQQHLDILKTSLQTQGIHVTHIAVDIKNKDEQNSGQGAARSKGKKGRSIAGVDGVEEEGERDMQLVRLDLEKGLLHWIG